MTSVHTAAGVAVNLQTSKDATLEQGFDHAHQLSCGVQSDAGSRCEHAPVPQLIILLHLCTSCDLYIVSKKP